MTVAKDKIRKEVQFKQEVLDLLQLQADKDGRTLKNLMEYVLIQYSKTIKK
jgi:hypothetical protein